MLEKTRNRGSKLLQPMFEEQRNRHEEFNFGDATDPYTTLLSIATCTNTITGKGGVGITRHGTKILQTPETKHRRGQRSVQTYFDFDFTETNTNSNLSSSRLGLIGAAASRLRLLVHCIFPAVPSTTCIIHVYIHVVHVPSASTFKKLEV